MKRTISTSEAAHMLLEDENANWSYSGAYALAEYLEECEEDCGVELEFDCVAIRCDWTEFSSALEAASEYDFEPDEDDDEEAKEAAALEWLRDRTSVIEFDGGVIVQLF